MVESDCRQNPSKGSPFDGFCHFWIGIALKTLISSPDACFPGGVRRASSSRMLVRGLGCHAIPPGVKRLPLPSTRLAPPKSRWPSPRGHVLYVHGSKRKHRLHIKTRKVVHHIPCFSFAFAKTRSIVFLRFA